MTRFLLIHGGALAAFLCAAPSVLAAPGAEVLDSLNLEQAVRLAMARDERARAAGEDAVAAHERVAVARSFFFPDLTLSGALIRRPREVIRQVGDQNVIIQRYNALQGFAVVSQPLFDARFLPLYRQAKLLDEAARLNASEQRRLVGFEAADAFLMVLNSQEVVRAARRRQEFSQDRLRDARARVEAGLVSINDQTRSRLEVATAARELTVAGHTATVARLELSHLLLAEVRGGLVEPRDLLTRAATAGRDSVPLARAATQRMDLQAAEKGVQAAREAALEPRRRIIPSLTLSAQGRYTNEAGLTGRNFDWLASMAATWQLWDGGERSATARERDAVVRAAALERRGLGRSIERDVRRAIAALQSAQATQTSSQDAAQIALAHANETAELYRQGLSGALQVADANLRLFEAEVILARDRYALALAFLDLGAALGESPPGAAKANLR